jgi:hypothetical protein
MVDAEVASVLRTMARVSGITVNDVVRRLLGLEDHGSATSSVQGQAGPPRGASARTVEPQATDGSSRTPWMHEIPSYLPLRMIAERFNACLDRAVANTVFGGRTVSGMYVATPNFVTVKPQLRAGTLRISVYGPLDQLPRSSIELRGTRHPYCEFLFTDSSNLDDAVLVLERAYQNRIRR